MDKVEFATSEWYEALLEEVRSALKDHPSPKNINFTLLERYTNEPEAMRLPGGLGQGFLLSIVNGEAELRPGAKSEETADVVIAIEWNTAKELASLPHGDAFNVRMEHFLKTGLVILEHGDLAQGPLKFERVHDGICARTL